MNTLLPTALSAAVPLLIADLEQAGGPSDSDLAWLAAYSASGELAERGDVLQYGGRKGEAALLFNNLARALSILAFAPGGVTFCGTRYEGVRP